MLFDIQMNEICKILILLPFMSFLVFFSSPSMLCSLNHNPQRQMIWEPLEQEIIFDVPLVQWAFYKSSEHGLMNMETN